MRHRPAALAWIDHERTAAPEWDAARVQQLARKLGYGLLWPGELSMLSVADRARNAGVDVVIMPAPDHLSPLELNAVMNVADVETVLPRLSFARWSIAGVAR